MGGNRELPRWFDDAKLGIFIHWTAASVPAFAPVGPSPFELAAEFGSARAFSHCPYVEWYENSLAIPGSPVAEHHRSHYGDLPYDAFVETFLANLDGWDPEPWVDLFASVGARYVVLVTKHHDGVMLWPSSLPNPHKPNWQSKRDIVGELAAAVRARGMRFGTYYSGGIDWTFGGLPITDWRGVATAIPQSQEYLDYADGHWRELIERYEPCVLWNDIGYPAAADLDALFSDYWSQVPDGVINNRFDFIRQTAGDVHCDFFTPEYSSEGEPGGKKWESTRGIGTSFGYNREEDDSDYLASDDLIRSFIDLVARGGNLLLNVGPNADGAIPMAQASRLLALGHWLRTNGEALFDSRPGGTPLLETSEGIPVRCTVKGVDRYAVVLGTPSTDSIEVRGLDVSEGDDVALLGRRGGLSWTSTGDGVAIRLPARPADGPALALRITPRSKREPFRSN